MTRILYIDAGGDNATAEIGNPSKPFSTAQAAFDAALAGAGNYLLKFGVGSFGAIVLPSGGWPSRIAISGCGYSVSRLTGINGNGANGAAGTNHATTPTAGAVGGAGRAIFIRSDGTINLGAITANGGTGGVSGAYSAPAAELQNGAVGVTGADGGAAGEVELVGVVYDSITARGGNGAVGGVGQNGGGGTFDTPSGNAGDGGVGGNPGARGAMILHNCRCTYDGGGDVESVNGEVGAGGAAGDIGFDTGGGAGLPGLAGADGTAPTGFSADLIFVDSRVGTISSVTTMGVEVALNTCYTGCNMDGVGGVIAGDLGGNIETTFHKLP